jgi:hypothetical protein
LRPTAEAPCGSAARFDHGRWTIYLPAELEVTTKAVRPTAEAIGGDIAESERKI